MFGKLVVNLQRNQVKIGTMEVSTTNKSRTREEIIAWWERAKKRKAAWEAEMQKKFDEEEQLRKQAEESTTMI